MQTRFVNAWALALALSPAALSQSTLMTGDVGVATSDGIFLVRNVNPVTLAESQAAAPCLLPVGANKTGAFQLFAPPPGVQLDDPAIEHEHGTDNFFVVAGADVYRAMVSPGVGTTFATTLVPIANFASSGARFTDVEQHPATGDLWLLDDANDIAVRLPAPVGPSSQPESFTLDGQTLALSVDSANFPQSLAYANSTGLSRRILNSPTSTVELPFAFSHEASVDVDPQTGDGIFYSHRSSNTVRRLSPGGQTTLNLNSCGGAFFPVVSNPNDVEWDPGCRSLFVLAEDLEQACFPCKTTGNLHIVRITLAQLPGQPPNLVTPYLTPSGISGSDGDLAIVRDYAFPAPYGTSCQASTGEIPLLLPAQGYLGVPTIPNSSFAIEITDAPANRPAYLGVDFQAASIPQPFTGCEQAIPLPLNLWSFMGVTNGAGKLTLAYPILPTAVAGLSLFAQAGVVEASSANILTNGLELYFQARPPCNVPLGSP